MHIFPDELLLEIFIYIILNKIFNVKPWTERPFSICNGFSFYSRLDTFHWYI